MKKENTAYESAHGALNAFLDKGSAFEGKLTFKGIVRIDGKFTGDILSDDTLLVGESGALSGTTHVGEADISGEVEGNLRVLGRAHFRPSATFNGELSAGRLIIDEGATVNGQISMQNQDAASEAAKIQEEMEKTLV